MRFIFHINFSRSAICYCLAKLYCLCIYFHLSFYKKNPLRVSASYFIIAVAIFIGVYLIKLCPQYIGTDVMNQFHLKQMLRFSITLFLENRMMHGSNHFYLKIVMKEQQFLF